MHADQIQGFFDVPVDHLYGSSIFIPYIKSLNLPNLTFASPDTGGTRRAGVYAKVFGSGFVICYKQRNKPNEVGKMQLIGDVKGKDVILLDDIIDTGNTICKAAEVMMENGASSVRAVITHPLLTGNAYQKIKDSVFTEIVVSDTIPLKQECEKIKVISTSKLISDVIRSVESNESISALYNFENK